MPIPALEEQPSKKPRAFTLKTEKATTMVQILSKLYHRVVLCKTQSQNFRKGCIGQDKSNGPAEMRGNLPEMFTSSKKRTKLHSIRLPLSGCRPHPP